VNAGRFEVPGTYVFDTRDSHRGYRLNKMLMSLRVAANRERFLADEIAYCAECGLTDQQRAAVVGRDWQGMLDLGGSIFYVFKLALVDGKSMQYLGGEFTGMTEAEFTAMMRSGGRADEHDRPENREGPWPR
jgi:protocatechuate 4,5-dioxygenase, alpha chain